MKRKKGSVVCRPQSSKSVMKLGFYTGCSSSGLSFEVIRDNTIIQGESIASRYGKHADEVNEKGATANNNLKMDGRWTDHFLRHVKGTFDDGQAIDSSPPITKYRHNFLSSNSAVPWCRNHHTSYRHVDCHENNLLLSLLDLCNDDRPYPTVDHDSFYDDDDFITMLHNQKNQTYVAASSPNEEKWNKR